MSKTKYSDERLRELQESVFFKPSNQSQNETDSPTQKLPPVRSQNASKRIEKPNTDEIPSDVKTEASTTTKKEYEQINEVTNVRTNERSIKRAKIRHTFDIYEDQLLSLKEIALVRQRTFGEKTLLGDLVQEALDTIITKERNKE